VYHGAGGLTNCLRCARQTSDVPTCVCLAVGRSYGPLRWGTELAAAGVSATAV
jgi:hypothetical protein